MPYLWEKNICCIGTYKTLSDNQKLDEFEEEDKPFENAATVKMNELRYFLHATANPQALEHLSFQKAIQFLTDFSKNYLLTKEKKELQTADFIRDLAGIFKDGNKTINDLAELMDSYVKFADE
jgi:hypothetical protein